VIFPFLRAYLCLLEAHFDLPLSAAREEKEGERSRKDDMERANEHSGSAQKKWERSVDLTPKSTPARGKIESIKKLRKDCIELVVKYLTKYIFVIHGPRLHISISIAVPVLTKTTTKIKLDLRLCRCLMSSVVVEEKRLNRQAKLNS
jgi:hypothetical protein